tara:strand:- start:84 stop:4217 length:4134 start_codon:yes stop_codon:yes gene_type:complete
MAINTRVFGAPIKGTVKTKLEERQKEAKQVKFGESVNIPKTADLSSRTPFVRMWTGIKIIDPAIVGAKATIITIEEMEQNGGEREYLKKINNGKLPKRDLLGTQYITPKFKKVYDEDDKTKLKEYQLYDEFARDQIDVVRKIYQIGNHAYQEAYGEFNPNNPLGNDLQIRDTEVSGKKISSTGHLVAKAATNKLLPNELAKNPLLKPQSGIISMTSDTKGALGLVKETTVEFMVHNFYDFDKIYNKYFLKPGATVFVDYGWNDITDLYSPTELLDSEKNSGGIREFLYGEQRYGATKNGIITDNEGDFDVIQGVVTDYNAKIEPNGSVRCSVTLTSANSTLLGFKAGEDEQFRIEQILTKGIMFIGLGALLNEPGLVEATQNWTSPTDKVRELKQLLNTPNADSSVEEFQTYEENIEKLAIKQFTNTVAPSGNQIRAGIFIDSINTNDVYISWGRFEDLIINSQFGFGKSQDDINNGVNLQVRLDSSNSMTTFSPTYYNGQSIVMNSSPENNPELLYPQWWGIADIQNQPDALIHFENADGTWQSFEELIDERIDRVTTGDRMNEEFRSRKIRQTMSGSVAPLVDEDDQIFIDAVEKEKFDDVTYTVDGAREGGASYTMLKQKYPKQYYNERYAPDTKGGELFTNRDRGGSSSKRAYINTLRISDILKHDKDEKIIPIRECFIRTETIIDAFKSKKNNNVRKIVKEILDKINGDSGGLFNWQLKSGATDSELEVIDLNLVETEISKNIVNLNSDSGFFKFNVMSPNSIVKDYNFELKTPSDSISNYYALQAMSHDSELFPIDEDVSFAISSVMGLDEDSLSIIYEPDIGKYRLEQSLQRKNDTQMYNVYNTLKPLITSNVSHLKRVNNLIKSTELNALSSINVDEDGKEDKSNNTKDNAARYTAMIQQNDDLQTANGFRLVQSIREYLGMKSYIEDVSQLGVLMPYFLNLSTYGISAIAPGDTFQVDYLPEMYQSSSYVQTMKVSQKIDKSGWFTTLDTQFRIKGIDRAGSLGVANDERTRLSSAWLRTLDLTPAKVSGDDEQYYTFTARKPKERSGKMDSLISVMTDINIKPNVIQKAISMRNNTKIGKSSKGYIVTFKTARNLDNIDRRLDYQSAYAELDFYKKGKLRLANMDPEPARSNKTYAKRGSGKGNVVGALKLANIKSFSLEKLKKLKKQPNPPVKYGRNSPYGEEFWAKYPNCKGWAISKKDNVSFYFQELQITVHNSSINSSAIGGALTPTWELAPEESANWTGGKVGEGWFKIPIVTDLYGNATEQNLKNPFMFYSPWTDAQIHKGKRGEYGGYSNWPFCVQGTKIYPPRVYLQPNTNYTMLIYGKSNAIFQDSLYTPEQLEDLILFFSNADNEYGTSKDKLNPNI